MVGQVIALPFSSQTQPMMAASNSKRQASHFEDQDADAASNKRRCQRDEFQYTVATIHKTLADAGRPHMAILSNRRERALPLGSVNMELAKVVSSSEYDRQEAEMATAAQQDKQGGDRNDETDLDKDHSSVVSSMYMMANLIQSTRHYYSHSVASDDAAVNSARALSKDKQSEYNHNYGFKKASTEDNSEGFSSWAPSSSYGELTDNNRKNIDNDNRSDAQSSCGSDDGDELLSDNNISSVNHDERSTSLPVPCNVAEKTKDPFCYIVGWKKTHCYSVDLTYINIHTLILMYNTLHFSKLL